MIPPPISLACGGERDASGLRDREWLVTNGLGGYGSGTVPGFPRAAITGYSSRISRVPRAATS